MGTASRTATSAEEDLRNRLLDRLSMTTLNSGNAQILGSQDAEERLHLGRWSNVKFEYLQGGLERLSPTIAEACAKAGRHDAGHGSCQGYRLAGCADQADRRGLWGGPGRTKMRCRAQRCQFAAIQCLRDCRYQQ